MKMIKLANPVKEAIDHLPSGLCFFDENGLLILCNILMDRLAFALTGRDLQIESDLSAPLESLPDHSTAIGDGKGFWLPDGTVWQFSRYIVQDREGRKYREYIATNVTQLYRQQEKLKEDSEEQKKLALYMDRITKNIIAITREEEILSMKMQIHGEVGWCLQELRQYYTQGCPPEGKDHIIERLGKITATLQGEVGHDDEPDILGELMDTAASAGVEIIIKGELPRREEGEMLVIAAIRECLTNTLYHAEGNEISVSLTRDGDQVRACITNNGRPPKGIIVEGGGLTTLRRRIENAGGRVLIQSLPSFALDITIPDGKEETL